MDKKKTGQLIKEARTKKNYTQSELGELVGVTNKAVSRWENGESFPDIGVLEVLSNVLDLSIDEIVLGERSNKEDNIVVEVIRIAKMQEHERWNKGKKQIIGILAIAYVCLLVLTCLWPHGTLSFDWRVVHAVSFLVVVELILWNAYHEKRKIGLQSFQKNAIRIVLPTVTYIAEIAIIFWIFFLLKKGIMPFGVEPYKIGPVLVTFLGVIFAINMILIIYMYYEMIKRDGDINIGIFIALAAVFLSGLNADLLYQIATFEGALRDLWMNIGIISVEMLASIVAGILLSRKRE